ncbi:hypothetical protein QUF90_03445 [Desulfococcaceae bacterium HSG9]|nr:hypothetical protein [Desulfococcaceae bacterium HSG9]
MAVVDNVPLVKIAVAVIAVYVRQKIVILICHAHGSGIFNGDVNVISSQYDPWTNPVFHHESEEIEQ